MANGDEDDMTAATGKAWGEYKAHAEHPRMPMTALKTQVIITTPPLRYIEAYGSAGSSVFAFQLPLPFPTATPSGWCHCVCWWIRVISFAACHLGQAPFPTSLTPHHPPTHTHTHPPHSHHKLKLDLITACCVQWSKFVHTETKNFLVGNSLHFFLRK